jgi:hypothetical protein
VTAFDRYADARRREPQRLAGRTQAHEIRKRDLRRR